MRRFPALGGSLVLLFFISAVELPGLDFVGLEFDYDLLLHVNTVSGSAPSPMLGTVGASARLRLLDNLIFSPGLGFYSADFLHDGTKTLPAEIEYRDAVTVLGILLEAPFLMEWRVSEAITIQGGGGPTLRLAAPLAVHGSADLGTLLGYYYAAARFIFLELRADSAFDLGSGFSVLLRARTLAPVYRVWDGLGLPFAQELAVGLGVGIRYTFQ